MTLWKLTTREIRRRPGRATLTLLSVTIGIAAVVSVSLGTATARQAYRRMYEEISGRSALQITAEGGGTFPDDLATQVQGVPGVKAAVPSLQRRTVLFFQHKRLDLLVLGIDPARDSEVRDFDLSQGRFLRGGADPGALLEAGFAQGAGIKVGDEVKLAVPRGTLEKVTVVGILAPRGAAGFNKGGIVFLSLRFAERWFARPEQVNTIDLVLEDGADEGSVAAAVKGRIPTGLDVHPPATRTQIAKDTLLEIEQGLQLASNFALVLAFIIIVNTFLMNASERRGQLAILRALGATRRQIMKMLLVEGLLMGVLGAVLGSLLGLAGGYVLMGAIARMFVGTPPPIIFTPAPFALAAVVGPGVAVLAASIPAYLATRVPPVEAMRPAVARDTTGVPRWLTVTGVVMSTVAGGILVGCVAGWVFAGLAPAAGVVFVAAFVLLIPRSLGLLARGASWMLLPFPRLELRLAERQVRRRPVRNALTIGVLYLAVAMGIGLGTTIINNVEDVRTWYRRTIVGDFFLRAAFVDTATGQTIEIPLSLGEEIRRIPGVTNIDTMRYFRIRAAGRQVLVVARDFTDDDLPLDLSGGNPREIRRRLLEGEVVIGTVLAHEAGLSVGDEIPIETREGPKRLRIAGLAVDYLVGGSILHVRRSAAERLFHVEGVSAFLVKAAPGSRSQVHAALAALAERHSLMFHSFADLSDMLDRIIGGVVGSLWGILVLGFVVAAFGVANTLTMNVLEQTRELALLRVVAMTRRQIRRMVLSQAGIIGILGLGLGTVIGIVTAYAISLGMLPLLGYSIAFILHPSLLLGTLGLGMALVLLAALAPAERAARLDLLLALQYE